MSMHPAEEEDTRQDENKEQDSPKENPLRWLTMMRCPLIWRDRCANKSFKGRSSSFRLPITLVVTYGPLIL
jgi:hypothetical protein